MLRTTALVNWRSHAPPNFSTQAVIRSLGPAVPDPGDLESFAFSVAGAPLTAADRNMWGVTFADDGDTYYATAASGPRSSLVRWSMSARTMTAIHDAPECPSLSPDETRVAYKKDVGDGVPDWRIAVLNLASGVETMLPEELSVDDQVA
ncbi:hypothetical protein [Rathayibacter sp. VKM Ac-2760]|uniref:hypothetical protein n=1 Tax=Rathayibacter sp. VKM Ac-2760 TaxID=2609253 RepID=UPI0013161EA7|nr:hypothetical protein [Rathayibacter sp. VKM Ac-2760]QHC60427.1 hypothetical protein GSU72_19120 [Rathayibacter sp. VKM Ac-2760]